MAFLTVRWCDYACHLQDFADSCETVLRVKLVARRELTSRCQSRVHLGPGLC